MKNRIILLLLFFLPQITFAKSTYHELDLTRFHQLFGEGALHAGFGLARDVISYAYKGADFAPRDFDFAVIKSGLSEQEAREALSEMGKIVRVLDVHGEKLVPSGQVFGKKHGFVIIIEHQGIQLDFKFFENMKDAHNRGLFNVDKILFPLEGRSINGLLQDVKAIAEEGRLPNSHEVIDPYRGVEGVLFNQVKTVNWAKAAAGPVEWAIRSAMIRAKMGGVKLPPEEKKAMKIALRDTMYIRDNEKRLVDRAISHKKWWEVRRMLGNVGFFREYRNWLGEDLIRQPVMSWLKKSPPDRSCRVLFAR